MTWTPEARQERDVALHEQRETGSSRHRLLHNWQCSVYVVMAIGGGLYQFLKLLLCSNVQ